MKPEDFSKEKFVLKIPFHGNRERAFELLATSRGLESWFLGKVDFFDGKKHLIANGSPLNAGDTFEWVWQKGHRLKGTVLKYIYGEIFEFTFGTDFVVAFTLKDISPGRITQISLTQSNLNPTDSNEFGFLNCCVCWTFFLTNLKSVGENQIDLRETEIMDETFINQ